MPKADDLLRTIEAVHAAGLDEQCWPQALSSAIQLIGGVAATLEAFDKKTLRPGEWHAYGIPKASEIQYFDQYALMSPRPAITCRLGVGGIGWDYLVLDEAALHRNPFYADFLSRDGFCYFISTNLVHTQRDVVAVAIHRSPRQGHVGRREIDLMRRLTPHLQQAYDVTRRLRQAQSVGRAIEHAFDWLTDGVMLVTVDGAVTYVNVAMQDIARRGDGVRIARAQLELSDGGATARYRAALGQIGRLRNGSPDSTGADFTVRRASGAPPYLVSVRPLARRSDDSHDDKAAAIVFVHDPLKKNAAAMHALREAFGLTDAEAALAEALQSGATLSDYARDRRLSLNTIYTHLRRLKEKIGCTRLPELIRKLTDAQIRIRSG